MNMKRNLRKIAAILLILAMALALTACGDKADNGGSAVTGVTLDITSADLGPGDTQRLAATVQYKDGTSDSTVEWSSSDEAVATVTRGVIIAKAAGSATITAAAGGKTATCAVTVADIVVEISAARLDMERNTEAQLTAQVKKGAAATGETIIWSTSDDRVATVDDKGLVKAVGEGVATITAQRADANQKAACTVTIVWTRPEGYVPIDYYEQNKVPTDTWGYWNDPANYVGGTSEMYEAYYQTSEGEAGRANFSFAVNSRSDVDLDFAIIQITYRSSTLEGGRLETNHDYRVSFDLISNVDGVVRVNGYADNNDNDFEITAGTNAITAEFRHGDWGVIYPEGIYTNVESAIFLLLGKLGAPGETVNVSVDNVRWEDLGASAEPNPEPDFAAPPPEEHELPAFTGQTVALELDPNNAVRNDGESYEVVTEDGGLSYTVNYAGVFGQTYTHLNVPVPADVDASACNAFAVTVTNNGESVLNLRIDLNGNTPSGENNVIDIATRSIASLGSASTDLTWGGTALKINPGDTSTLYIYYDAATERGPLSELNFAFDSAWEPEPAEHSGSVFLTGFAFGSIE